MLWIFRQYPISSRLPNPFNFTKIDKKRLKKQFAMDNLYLSIYLEMVNNNQALDIMEMVFKNKLKVTKECQHL